MATTIRLKDVNFDNPSLPLVTPLVRDGLQAAFRFHKDSSNNFVDLSGNGATLSGTGLATFSDNGVLLNDLQMAMDVNQSSEWNGVTLIALSKDIGDTSVIESFVLGNWSTAGALMTWIRDAAYPDQTIFNLVTKTTTLDGLTNTKRTLRHTLPTGHGEYIFHAITISEDSGKTTLSLYLPQYQDGAIASVTYDETWTDHTQAFAFGGSGNPVECCEGLVYNKALSPSQIKRQFELTQGWFKTVSGISI
ncbi:TPA: hypothetical protein ACN30N_004847 [Vibrio campbellii]